MKTLLILRHAKASKKIPPPPWGDADRPLNDRGRRDAKAMGKLLAELEMVPQIILTSSARRARKTAARLMKGCRYECEIEQSDSLYLAPPSVYVERLKALPKSIDVALVVGHNPGLEELILALTGRQTTLPTAALAEIELPIPQWSDLALTEDSPSTANASLLGVWRPREVLEG